MILRSRAAGVAVALIVSVTGVACGGGDDKDVKASGSSTSSTVVAGSTTSSTPGEPSASTTVPAGPATTARGGAPATTRAPAAPTPPVTAAPGPVALTPAAPGTYRYATSGGATFNGTPAPFPAVTTNVIDPPGGARQHSARDLRDAAGNGSIVEYTFEYRADGVYLVSIRFTTSVSGFVDVRDLTPPAPLLFLVTGAAAGASRTLDIPAGTAGTARVVVDVLGREQVTVAGQGIDTLIVRSTATLPPGDVTGTQSLTVNIDPATRLWVRERGVGDAAAAGLLTVHTEYTATLQSLTPG